MVIISMSIQIYLIISIKGWLRFDPSRGTDYRLMVQLTDKNNNETDAMSRMTHYPNVFQVNAFRELSMLPHYIVKPMKR